MWLFNLIIVGWCALELETCIGDYLRDWRITRAGGGGDGK